MSTPKPPSSILVVDDDLPLRNTLEICLRNAGHNVIGTCGRAEVMALLECKRFDLIVTDILMPELEGTEVIKAVREHQPGAALLAMSGGGFRLTPELCLSIASAMGAGVLLMKPFKIEAFRDAVERALASQEAT